MQTRLIKNLFGLGLVFIAMSCLGACADGDLNLEQPVSFDKVGSLAEISMFQVCQVGQPETCADSLTIEKGQSVELMWETADSTSVEIASEDGSFVGSPLEVSGSVVVEAIAVSTRFTLSAMTADGVAQKDVAVEVTEAQIDVTATLTASKASIAEGETADLCWTVTPPEATVTIVGDDGVTYFPVEGVEAKDSCITVAPAKATVYTLTAKVEDGREAPATATIEVVKPLSVTLEKSEVSEDNKVKLTWTIQGPEADSITIDKDVGDVKSLTIDGKGEKEVVITENTTFTITVTSGEQAPATAFVEVVMPAREVELTISINDQVVTEPAAEQPAEKSAISSKAASSGAAAEKKPVEINAGTYFENEDVKLSWNASVNKLADKITTVKLLDSAGGVVKEGLLAADFHIINVAGDGQYTLSISGSDIKETTAKISVNVRKWVQSTDEAVASKEVSALIADSADMNTLYAGFRGDMTKAGAIPFAKATVSDSGITSEMLEIGLGSLLAAAAPDINQSQFTDKMDTYPLNVIAQDPDKAGRLYAGSAGALMMSDDSGKTWVSVRQFLMVNTGEYTGSHKSCKGETQDGIKDDKIASYNQVCDIIAMNSTDNNRLIVATDREIIYLEFGVDKYLTAKDPVKAKEAGMSEDDRFNYAWAGMPLAGNEGNAVYCIVNHDLELVTFESGTRTLYAATEKGLFRSDNLGAEWTQETSVTLGSMELFAVAADAKNKKIYVGSADGIYYRDLAIDAADWQKATIDGAAVTPAAAPEEAAVEGAPATPAPTGSKVFSITVDPVQTGSVYAASGSGVVVSRDGGKTFKNVKSEKILSIVSKSDANGMVGIYAATAKGMAVSIAKPIVVPVAAQPETPPVEQPVVEETPAPVEGTVPTVGEKPVEDVVPTAIDTNDALLH